MLNGSQKTTLSLLAALALGAGGYEYWDLSKNAASAPAPKSAEELTRDSRSALAPLATEEAPPVPTTPVTDAASDEIDEAQALEELPDPDLSSESLIGFAHQLSGLMERAMSSEKEALPAYAELEQCAQNTTGKEVLQARLICFANASRLSKEFPSLLGTRFQTLSERNPKLVGLLQTTGLE